MSDQTVTDVMRAHAADAVAYAKSRFRMDLDLSSQSLERVDRILAAMYFDIPRTFFAKLFRRGPTDDRVWDWSKMWGGYVGEVIRKRWGGVWRSRLNPDGHAQISFDVLGQRYYPVEAMRRRLVEGHVKGKKGRNGVCGAQELYERIIKELGMARIDAMTPDAQPVAPPLPRKMDPIPPTAPLLTRRQTMSDVLGLELEDVTGERAFSAMDDSPPLDNLPLTPSPEREGTT